MKYRNAYLYHIFYCEELKTVTFICKPDVDFSLDKLKENYALTYNLIGPEKVKVLIDIRGLTYNYIPKESLQYVSDNPYLVYHERVAIILSSLGQRLLGNFYLSAIKPTVPTKLFTKEEAAISWLGINATYTRLTPPGLPETILAP